MPAVAVIGALTFVLSALSVKLQRTGVPPLLIALACGEVAAVPTKATNRGEVAAA